MHRYLVALFLITCLSSLSGCGLVYNSLVDSAGYTSPIPRSSDHDAVMAAARANPKDALISFNFYDVASPAEVREILAACSMKAGSQLHSNPELDSDASNYGALIFEVLFLPAMNLNIERHYPLIEALRATKYPEVLTMLLDAGATAPYWDVYFSSSEHTPEMFEILLTRCPLDNKDDYNKLLYFASGASDDPALLKVLLAKGPKLDLNMKDPVTDTTPLSVAIEMKRPTLARLLIQSGASPERVFGWNERAVGLALRTGQYAFAKELIDAGADCTYLSGKNNQSILLKVTPNYPYQPSPNEKPDWTMSAYLAARVLVDGETGQRAVEAACFTCSLPALKILLERGAVLRPANTYVLGPWLPEQEAMGKFLAARGIAFTLAKDYPSPAR